MNYSPRRFIWFYALLGTTLLVSIFSCSPTITEAKAKSKAGKKVLPYDAVKLIQSTPSLTIAAGASADFEVGYKNNGSETWHQNSGQKVTLRSGAKKESYFYGHSWKSGTVVNALNVKNSPGHVVYFKIILSAPQRPGVYTEQFSLFAGDTPMLHSKFSLPITVTTGAASIAVSSATPDRAVKASKTPSLASKEISPLVTGAKLAGAKLIQSAEALTITQNAVQSFEIGYKNTGTENWKSSGPETVFLRSASTRESYFHDASWVSKVVAVPLDHDAIPNELVYFRVTLSAPQRPGIYEERFFLTSGGKAIQNTEVRLPIAVVPKNRGATLASYMIPPNTLQPPVVPAYSTSTPAMNATSTQSAASSSSTSSTPLSVTSTSMVSVVTSTSSLPFLPSTAARDAIIDDIRGQEPLIRVGLFHSTEPIQITANKDFEIRDVAQNLVASVSSSAIVTIDFDPVSKLSRVITPQTSSTVTSYIRFVSPQNQNASSTPDQDMVFEIPSYSNHPAWSSSINDNKFRGTLEVRYAMSTDRLWVIEELPLEYYLRGIAETSNNSPYEFQKALIIAARTYAKYLLDTGTKHASENYTVRPTDADQVYRGYNAEIRLTNVTRAAQETRAVVAWYGNSMALTPYYSQSDGRTRAWTEVWGGSAKPWLVSKDDPACKGLPMLGHGVGMSARGAVQMAIDGRTYEQILKYYYTGIELHKIY